MPSKTLLEITTDESITDVQNMLAAPDREVWLQNFKNYLERIVASVTPASLGISSASQANVSLVKAAGLVTFTDAPAPDETLSICNVTFTAKASGATGNQFNIGGDVTATALALKNAINSSANLSGKVTADSALGVVTITCVVPGVQGNSFELSENMANTAVTAFAGGSGTVPDIYLALLNGALTSYSFNR